MSVTGLIKRIFLAPTHGQSVRLTDAGRAFLDNARALLQNEAVTKARAVASAEPTELHVAYSPMPTGEILPKTLRAFQQAMPKVHVRSHDWTNKDILDGIRDGRLQLGLMRQRNGVKKIVGVSALLLHEVTNELRNLICGGVEREMAICDIWLTSLPRK